MTFFDGWPILLENISFGVISGNINPPGAARDKCRVSGNPDLTNNQGLKTSWPFFVKFLKFVARSSNVVALTFRCGSRYGSPGIDCLEK